MTSLCDLPGLGPKSAAMLSAAGIATLADLQRLGAVKAYLRVKQYSTKASLNLLWALEGALTNTPWQTVAREQKLRLLNELAAVQESQA